ncbi:CoA-binding protein [Cellulophaga sp. F20128]|uniref:CoA-binding protein n=1 Tax=Cellulophaga sp. F20128 TaxID=2926413 RepID=UPI001FF6E453|nr:CoA-binding protein [Cellulophaga sp. F20128]MCK0158368.1 CoA-binding protein [Cellulophaga sp. F20128]
MLKTLVFGASLKPNRYSNLAVRKLLEKNIKTVAFGKASGAILDVQIKDNLMDIQNIHTVTLYLNPTRQEEYYQDIIKLNPKRVIFNPGTENPAFYKLLEKSGIQVLEACTLVLLATDQY